MLFRSPKKHTARGRSEPKSILHQVLYGVALLILVTAIIVSIWYVTRLTSFTIKEVRVSGGETISHDEVRTQVENELRGEYLRLVPHRFSFLYPHDAVVTALERIPRIHDISIVRKGRTVLEVAFSEYKPFALWCVPATQMTDCYFVDENGFAFASSPLLSGGALVRHTFENRTVLEVGQVLPTKTFADIHAFLAKVSDELSLRVTDVLHTKDNDIYFSVNGGGEIRIAGDDSLDAVFENLQSVLTSKDFVHLEPGNFQYIDLRFGSKIFVNEEELKIATTTATTTEL